MRELAIIINNVRSAHNVGSILRTAEGFGAKVYITGYSPYPKMSKDLRMPHTAAKSHAQIAKTALGAEILATWSYQPNITKTISNLKKKGYEIAALEQSSKSTLIQNYKPKNKVGIIVGSEIGGINRDVLGACDIILQIPMFGKKESFNVSVAAGIALFHSRFGNLERG